MVVGDNGVTFKYDELRTFVAGISHASYTHCCEIVARFEENITTEDIENDEALARISANNQMFCLFFEKYAADSALQWLTTNELKEIFETMEKEKPDSLDIKSMIEMFEDTRKDIQSEIEEALSLNGDVSDENEM